MLCHLGRHANTAVRSAVAGNEAGVHSVLSRETKEIGHPCPNELCPPRRMVFARIDIRLYDPAIFRNEIPIDARDVVFVFLDDTVFSRRCFVSLPSSGNT